MCTAFLCLVPFIQFTSELCNTRPIDRDQELPDRAPRGFFGTPSATGNLLDPKHRGIVRFLRQIRITPAACRHRLVLKPTSMRPTGFHRSQLLWRALAPLLLSLAASAAAPTARSGLSAPHTVFVAECK